jgi:DUF4097 and DUF4098 domain-containing protein YvlB
MPTFNTPDPIFVTLEITVGDIRISASDRRDTVVAICPSDSAKKSDVSAAEQARVEYENGRLVIRAPKRWRQYAPRSGSESIDIQIDLPSGSHVEATAGVAAMHCTGRLGECHYKTGVGDIHVDQAGSLECKTGGGDITIDRVDGSATVTSGTGTIRIGTIAGSAVVKNLNGDTWMGEVTGEARINAANGKISIDHAGNAVTARTANGNVCIGQVAHGAIVAQTACGKVEVGVLAGVAAWLDLNTHFGVVDSSLDATDVPEPGGPAVEVRARSSFGDITIRRS